MRIFILFIFLLSTVFSNIQGQEYSFNNIADSLIENASAIIRLHEKEFVIYSKSEALLTEKFVVTILNKSGEKYGIFKEYYDPLVNLKVKKANFYNSQGQLIKKIKQKEIKDYSAVSGFSLYDDSRVKYIKPIISNYPYTIEYEFTKHFNGLINYTAWIPIYSYDVSIEKSVFKFNLESKLNARFYDYNISANDGIDILENENYKIWQLLNFKAIDYEPYSPSFIEITPTLILAPKHFSYDGYEGDMTSWLSFGKWIAMLNSGRSQLDTVTQIVITKLIAEKINKYEIVKSIYEYVQSKTRYVSIQLGIGGWQPFPAETVDRLGYGDCKALSNYTMSMLDALGIKSYYTLVKAGKNPQMLIKEFANNQFNHVILCVPMENDTIWLECTDQRIPFGYLGKFTDDRDVLIIKETGGELAHTTVYRQDQNKQINKAVVTLNADGSGNCSFSSLMKGLQYDNLSYLLYESPEDQKKELYEEIDIENIKIENFSFEEKRNRIPEFELNVNLKLNKYASKVGSRLFVPINLMNKWTYIPKEVKNRKTPVILKRAYHDIDTVTYNIPESYEIEYLPESDTINSIFGTYIISTKQIGNSIKYVRDVKYNSGNFEPEDYEKLREFYKAISKKDNAKIILKEKK